MRRRWTGCELATYLSGLDDDFDANEAYQRQEDALDRAWAIAWSAVHDMPAILTPIQMSMLPSWSAQLWRLPVYTPRSIRVLR